MDIPPEIRDAEKKLEEARKYVESGDITKGREVALEALGIIDKFMGKKPILYTEQIAELLDRTEDLIREIKERKGEIR